MTLTQRAEIRKCGKRFGTEDEARHSKLALAGGHGVVPCAYGCGGWHLERIQTPARMTRKPPKDDGLTPAVRQMILERDGYACVCCGRTVIGQQYSLQDRKRRSQGGKRVPTNLITVLGSGTTGCHERIDSRRDPHDEAKGYTVRSHDDPALIPVMYFSEGGSGFTAWLLADGSLSFDGPEAGAA